MMGDLGGHGSAYTILGVREKKENGMLEGLNTSIMSYEVLLLDPHYTGIDEISSTQSGERKKSTQLDFCFWRDVLDFFLPHVTYNFCLPQKPLP